MKKRYLTGFALVLMMALPALLLGKDYGKLGNLWLPEGTLVETNGGILVASAGDSTGLIVRAYQTEVKREMRNDFLKARAVELGIPTFVRTLSEQQREMAGIDWGGYVLGTLPRELKNDAAGQEREVQAVDSDSAYLVDNEQLGAAGANTLEEAGSAQEGVDEGETGKALELMQPEGSPSIQHMVLLYVKGKQCVVLEMTVNLPEGDSMVLTNIQRRWKLGK